MKPVTMRAMIALFTDFGATDPYVGQMHAVLASQAPGVPIIDLFHHVPDFDIRAAAYLLPAYSAGFGPRTVFVCVVDPGVGGTRRALMVEADGRWFVGPDNGMFELVARRASRLACYEIRWRPQRLSESFHGRDLFAPVAARLARGERPESAPCSPTPPGDGPWPDDLPCVLYVDHYGNAVTGMRADSVAIDAALRVGDSAVEYARVFGDAPHGVPFWYRNANGLVEFAVNQGRADKLLDLAPGRTFTVER